MRHSWHRVCFLIILLCFFGVLAFTVFASVPVHQTKSTASAAGDHRIFIEGLDEGQAIIIKAFPSISDRRIWASRLAAETFSLSPFSYTNGQAEYRIETPGDYSFLIPSVPENTTFSIGVWNESDR